MRPVLRSTSAITAFLALLAVLASSGSFASRVDAAESPLRPGVWALQYRISNNFTLGSFEGSWLSVKRHKSERTAYRLGLSLDLRGDDADVTNYRTGQDDDTRTQGMDRRTVAIDLQVLRYAGGDEPVRPFFGAGPLLQYSYVKDERIQDVSITTTTKQSQWTFGASAFLGVEWLLTGSIGVHAEYGAAFTYFTRDETNELVNASETGYRQGVDVDQNGWSILSRGVLFGLSVYF